MESSEPQLTKKIIKSPSTPTSPVLPKKSFLKKVKYFFTLILFVGILVLGYLYYKADKELKLVKDPKAQTEFIQKEVDKVIAKIAKVVLMKEDDKLLFVGTVQDPEILKKEQAFFTYASPGDYIFVFEKTKRVILWNANKDMIINFGFSSESEIKQPQAPTPEKTSTKPDSKQTE